MKNYDHLYPILYSPKLCFIGFLRYVTYEYKQARSYPYWWRSKRLFGKLIYPYNWKNPLYWLKYTCGK